MKLLRRLPAGITALIPSIFVFGALLTGCETSYQESMFSSAPPPVAPAVAAPQTADAQTAVPQAAPSQTFLQSLDPTDPKVESAFQVGDTVTITFSGVSDQTQPYEEEIKGDGTIRLPLIGSMQAAGKTPGQLQKEVYDLYAARYYKPSSGFTVTVKPQPRIYYIGGEVKAPGPKLYMVGITVTKAIQSASDFTDYSNKHNIQLKRADGTIIKVNWNRAIKDPRYDPAVFPGDTIQVKRRIF